LETTSVRHVFTFSVIPSDSIISLSTPASKNFCPRFMSFPGSEVPIASSSPAEVSPPAPNWIPSSGLAIRLWLWTLSIRRSQSSAGKERKPEESSITSKLTHYHVSMRLRKGWEEDEEEADPRSLHLRRYFSNTDSVSACVRRCSAHPPCSSQYNCFHASLGGRRGAYS
jgi:hypothetical protein